MSAPSLAEVEVILPVLLVFLAGTISLTAALAAFIISRAFDRSAFRAICYAAATFAAVLTLILLALTFVQNAWQDEYTHSHGRSTVYGSSVIVNGNGESTSWTSGHARMIRVSGRIRTAADVLS